MLVLSHVTCLYIDFDRIFTGILIDRTEHSPHLQSRVVKSLTSMQQRQLSVEGTRAVRWIFQKTNISKLRVINVLSLNETQFLIGFLFWNTILPNR